MGSLAEGSGTYPDEPDAVGRDEDDLRTGQGWFKDKPGIGLRTGIYEMTDF